MTTARGFAVGTLTLIALEVFTRDDTAGEAAGVLGVASNLFRSFLSPNVPAIHSKGHWGTGAAAAAAGGVKASKYVAPIGLAPATPGTPLVVGLNAVNPEKPVNA